MIVSAHLGADADALEKVIKNIGRNAVVGKERFVWFPIFWKVQCEKANTLTETLELIRAFGFVYHFLDESKN